MPWMKKTPDTLVFVVLSFWNYTSVIYPNTEPTNTDQEPCIWLFNPRNRKHSHTISSSSNYVLKNNQESVRHMRLCLHPTRGESVDSVLSQLRALAVFYEPVWSSRGDSGCLDGKSVSRRKHFPSAVSPSLSRGCSFPPHSPSSRLVQRPCSCRSLSKAQLDIFYVQDVGFLRTTLIIYLFHFSCVIVPIFYTKVLSLL